MKKNNSGRERGLRNRIYRALVEVFLFLRDQTKRFTERYQFAQGSENEKGDVPGWVLVVLMTTGLVTAIWTIAAPRLTTILRNSLDSMNGIR